MFEGFESRHVNTERGSIFTLIGGRGPAVLLLHGYPQTHLMWHPVVQELAIDHTVFVVALPGYGASFRPHLEADHGSYSKRRIAIDLIETMYLLGFETFAVAGHDRGGRVAYRMALDFPERVTALAVFDIVPTAEVWRRVDAPSVLAYWHWAFLAQLEPLPEALIGANPSAFFDLHVRSLGVGQNSGRYPPEVIGAYLSLLEDPTVVAGICEYYRAGAGVDRVHDEADRSIGMRIMCPVLVLWSTNGALAKLYRDVLAIWEPWTTDLRGRSVKANHFLGEDQPEEVVQA